MPQSSAVAQTENEPLAVICKAKPTCTILYSPNVLLIIYYVSPMSNLVYESFASPHILTALKTFVFSLPYSCFSRPLCQRLTQHGYQISVQISHKAALIRPCRKAHQEQSNKQKLFSRQHRKSTCCEIESLSAKSSPKFFRSATTLRCHRCSYQSLPKQ